MNPASKRWLSRFRLLCFRCREQWGLHRVAARKVNIGLIAAIMASSSSRVSRHQWIGRERVALGGKRLGVIDQIFDEQCNNELRSEVDVQHLSAARWRIAEVKDRLERFELLFDLPANR